MRGDKGCVEGWGHTYSPIEGGCVITRDSAGTELGSTGPGVVQVLFEDDGFYYRNWEPPPTPSSR
jgi:hypothetical protein